MAESIKMSLQLLRESWGFVKYNKDLLLFPFLNLLGLCCVIAILFNIITSEVVYLVENETFPSLARIITVFTFWFFFVFNFIFFSAACVGVIYYRIVEQKNFSLFDGILLACKRLWPLALWTALWACGITILYFAARWIARFKWVQRILFIAIEFINTPSWFVLPIIVIERKSLTASIKDSVRIFKENWGKTAFFRYSVGTCFALVYGGVMALIGFASLIFGSLTGLPDTPNLLGNILVFLWIAYIPFFIFVLLVQSVFSATVRIALYQYATKKQVVANFNAGTLLNSIDTTPVMTVWMFER